MELSLNAQDWGFGLAQAGKDLINSVADLFTANAMRQGKAKEKINELIEGPIAEHLEKFRNYNPGDYGRPPENDWIRDIQNPLIMLRN